MNKGRGSKFSAGSLVRQTPEEGRRTYRPKRCQNDNKDEDNSPKTLNDKKPSSWVSKIQTIVKYLRILEENYKYLEIFEADTSKQAEMKEKIIKVYLRRTKKLFETNLYSTNM